MRSTPCPGQIWQGLAIKRNQALVLEDDPMKTSRFTEEQIAVALGLAGGVTCLPRCAHHAPKPIP